MVPEMPTAKHDPFATEHFTDEHRLAISQYLSAKPLDWSVTYRVDPGVTGPTGIHDVSVVQILIF